MNRELNLNYLLSEDITGDFGREAVKARESYEKLKSSDSAMKGWMDYPSHISDDLVDEISEMADTIRDRFSALVVVGIGGSYLGAAAALDFLIEDSSRLKTKIYFAGINLSTYYHEKLLREIEDEDVALCIISKSGGTTETLVTGNVFMDYLEQRYGTDGKKERLFIVTDPKKGKLRALSNAEGYPALPIPPGIGGRYSVLTPVGLLPMAAAGIDIKQILAGAISAQGTSLTEKAVELAAYRNIMENRGYSVELFASFDPYLTNLIQWIKQLYGESEGKDGKGMLPVDLDYTKDLHSLGQFVQDGRQIFFETVIGVNGTNDGIPIPKEWGVSDRDLTLSQLNDAARSGVINAHRSAGVPIIELGLPARDAHTFGQAVYFFQMTCALRGTMMGIDPFNQPGVEAYKEEMRKCLWTQRA